MDANISDTGLDNKYTNHVPAKVSLHLHAFKNSPAFENFNFHSLVCKLIYLGQATSPDIMYATPYITKYASDIRSM